MADLERRRVRCTDCSREFPDEDPDAKLGSYAPCPDCGSRTRYVRTDGANAVGIMISSKVAKRPGGKRSPVEEKSGDELERSTGRLMRVRRIVDRRNNYYYEKIHDPETRQVVREVEQPFTDHRGRGDAKQAGFRPEWLIQRS